MKIIPCTYKTACDFVNQHHRHHIASQGCKFCLGLMNDDKLCGVAICGRPVSRHLDNGFTLEINRLCTDGTRNACSKLYGACCRVAKEMGYEKVITYILESENGASLKSSNFICEGQAGGTHWTGIREQMQLSFIENKTPEEMKVRWARYLK